MSKHDVLLIKSLVFGLIGAGVISLFDRGISEQFRNNYIIGTIILLIILGIGFLINKNIVLYFAKIMAILFPLFIVICIIYIFIMNYDVISSRILNV